MPELKSISKEAVPAALAKAERYRLLNEPREAESICRDVLRVAPEHQQASIMLLLALTDQFGQESGVDLEQAEQLVHKLQGEYERAYYAGVISERWGKSRTVIGATAEVVHSWLRQAMDYYQQAEAIRPAGDDDALLRWNTCARIIDQGSPKQQSSGTEEFVWDGGE
jgi:hypothetical protein